MTNPLWVATIAASFLLGCNDPPPPGEVLLTHDSSSEVGDVRLGEPTTASHEAALSLGGRVEVRSQLATAEDGGQYITQIEVVVVDAEGWEMTAAIGGNPVNEGSSTGAGVRMSQSVMVSQHQAGLTGTTSGQTLITVHSDGSIEMD